jgi:glycosyltransferase involved in cell wall biosynthesis
VILDTSHGREAWRQGWKSSFLVDRLAHRCVDWTIAVSEANARFLVCEKHLAAEKIVVIHNGCDLARTPRPGAAAELRYSLAIGAEDPVLLVVGRLEPQKGHSVLLHALPSVCAAFPKVRVVLLGEGSLRPDLEKQARDLAIEANVCFAGFQANIPDWLELADFTVLPSFYEGLPLVAIESLAAGRTMVATAVDGTPEVIVHGSTGLTVPPGDAPALASAIRTLLANATFRHSLADAGRSWVHEHFTKEKQIAQTQQLYLRAWQPWEARHPRFATASHQEALR